MKFSRLFHVLVIGGALLAGSSCEGGGDDAPEADAPAGADVTSPAVDAAGGDAGGNGDGAALIDCFCNLDHDTCCDGTVPKEGFTCCWSTTC